MESRYDYFLQCMFLDSNKYSFELNFNNFLIYVGKLKDDLGKLKFCQVVQFDDWPQILIFSSDEVALT